MVLWALLALIVIPATARYTEREEQGLIQLGDFFKCADLPDKQAVLCPDGSHICKCPAGTYGELSMDPVTKKWKGVCSTCPAGYWSGVGSTSSSACEPVTCPPHSFGFPHCKCDKFSTGILNWMPCTGKWDGECIEIEIGALAPPVTTILQSPPRVSPFSSVTFFFQASSEGALFNCTMDNRTASCFPPSVSYEKLAQGPHVFSIRAIDELGQVEERPPVYRFEVKVPCPENSVSSGAPRYSCSCQEGFYSSDSSVQFNYTDGAYFGECLKCQSCERGAFRVGCGLSSPGTCDECSEGTFKVHGLLDSIWSTNCMACQSCGSGFYREGCDSRNPGACELCPIGTYKPDTGTWNTQCTECAPCPAGFQRIGCGDGSEGRCEVCPEHTYKETEGEWNEMCTQFSGCPAGSRRIETNSTSRGRCEFCPRHTYKTVGEEGAYDALCTSCTVCELTSGGYRANCGGPFGPGTCEICSECVGTPFNQCICDVADPQAAPLPTPVPVGEGCMDDSALLSSLMCTSCIEIDVAERCSDDIIAQLCPLRCGTCETAKKDNDNAVRQVLLEHCVSPLDCTCQSLYSGTNICHIESDDPLGRVMYSFCPETCADWRQVYLRSDLSMITENTKAAFSSFVEGKTRLTKPGIIGTCSALEVVMPKYTGMKEMEMVGASYITHLLQNTELNVTLSSVPEKPTFIDFFSPTCSHCKAFAPTWEQVAKDAPKKVGQVEVGSINCKVHMSVCENFQIAGYPTVAYFPPGQPMGPVIPNHEFIGERTEEEIISWMKKSIS